MADDSLAALCFSRNNVLHVCQNTLDHFKCFEPVFAFFGQKYPVTFKIFLSFNLELSSFRLIATIKQAGSGFKIHSGFLNSFLPSGNLLPGNFLSAKIVCAHYFLQMVVDRHEMVKHFFARLSAMREFCVRIAGQVKQQIKY